jgi:glutathione S-transferase
VEHVILYDSPLSGNAYKVRLLLAHLGLAYERRTVDVIDRSNRRDELAALNPTRRVPTLVLDDGRPLGESGAILLHLGEGTRFVPADSYDRARMLQWMFFEQADHMQSFAVARFLLRFSGRPDAFADRLPQLTKAGNRALATMERHLGGSAFLVGEELSLADIALFAYTHIADESGLDLEPYPAVRQWLERVASVPGHVPMDA